MGAIQQGAMENQSIYDVASECESLFNQHATKLQGQQGKLDNTYIILTRFIQNSQARFNAWASYMGAFAQPHLSLDQRLAMSEIIRQMVLEMLGILRDNLALLSTLIDQLTVTSGTLEQQASKPQYNPDQKELEIHIQKSKESIDGSVSRLHRLGVTIRQSSTAGLASRVKTFAAKSSKTSLEKITSLIVSFLYPRASASLKKLLSQSILDRYFRLKYEQRHQHRLSQRRIAPLLDEKDLVSTTEDIKLRENKREIAPTRNPDDIDQRPTPSKSQGELSKPSTLQDEQVLIALRNKPAISIATSASTVPIGDIQYPKPPKPDHPDLSYTACNLCTINFENVKFQDVRWWRKHVDQDLTPYICLTKECTNRDTAFSSYTDWKSHMNDVHSTSWIKNICAEIQWKCDFDNTIFQDEVSLKAHMTNSHQDLLTEEQISEVAFWSAVPIQPDVDRCPLCQYAPPPPQPFVFGATCIDEQLSLHQPKDFVGSIGEPKRTGSSIKKRPQVQFEDNLLAELDYSDDEITRNTPFDTDRNFTQPWSDKKSLERHISTHLKALSFMSLRLDAFQANHGISDDDDTNSQNFQNETSESGEHTGWDSDMDAMSLTFEDNDNVHDLHTSSQNFQGDTKESGVPTMLGSNMEEMSLPFEDHDNANDLHTNNRNLRDDTKESRDPTVWDRNMEDRSFLIKDDKKAIELAGLVPHLTDFSRREPDRIDFLGSEPDLIDFLRPEPDPIDDVDSDGSDIWTSVFDEGDNNGIRLLHKFQKKAQALGLESSFFPDSKPGISNVSIGWSGTAMHSDFATSVDEALKKADPSIDESKYRKDKLANFLSWLQTQRQQPLSRWANARSRLAHSVSNHRKNVFVVLDHMKDFSAYGSLVEELERPEVGPSIGPGLDGEDSLTKRRS